MAPGLSGRQTGTVPKSKPKSNGFHSHKQSRESYGQSTSLDWEPMSELGNKKLSLNKSSTHSETEADAVQSDVGRSRSSTMTSQNENAEDYPPNSLSNNIKASDHKQVVSKLSQIHSYLQQTADLMNTIKSSDSTSNECGDSRRMQKFSRIVNENYGPIMCTSNRVNNSSEAIEEELSRRPEESRKKLETLQKRKQDLLKLQDKAKKQLQEAQAEQSRLVARASSLNQELSSAKLLDINVHQLNQRLKAVQQMYNTRNQISESLLESRKTNKENGENVEDRCQEMSDAETDFQLVADKMEELNAMKTQLGEIQKIMASISGVQIMETSQRRETTDDLKERTNQNLPSGNEAQLLGEESNSNVVKLEQAKSKLNHLTQLLDIVQTAQNTRGLSPPYLQLVTNLVNEEAGSSTPSLSPITSETSPQKNCDEVSFETMQVMTRELEETTAAMKEERDKLEAARQELQNIAKRLPLNKPRGENSSPNDESESEPNFTNFRDVMNTSGPVEIEQSSSCNENSIYSSKRFSSRNPRTQGEIWNASLLASNSSTQERPSKNGTISRNSNVSSRGGSRSFRDPRWSPTSSVIYTNDGTNSAAQVQNQLEVTGNICDMVLSESGIRPGEISLQGMFSQHQLLTRTVAQCSQLLWLQQKQIIELRNAIMLINGGLPSFNAQQLFAPHSQANVPLIHNSPYTGFPSGPPYTNTNQYVPVPMQQHQNCHTTPQNTKLNRRDMQAASMSGQEYSEPFMSQANQQTFSIPDLLEYDIRYGNFNRLCMPISNSGQNLNQTVSTSSNARVANGMNCLGPEDSGALNNQVPPGNRANNYWDNFRSYSRQNLLSTSKSNEDTETSRRAVFSSTSHLDRPPRDVPPPLQNNQAVSSTSQQSGISHGISESPSSDQFLLPPSQNTQVNHHSQGQRNRSVECQPQRNFSSKNETRHQDNDSRLLSSGAKNEGTGGARARNPDGIADNIRSVRNDVSQSLRNTENLNSRNCSQSSMEDVARGINKKRPERSRCRKEGLGNLNNRGNHSTSLWDNISLEVSNFIRTNEARPHFLVQLFRDLQQVTTDNLRQRTLESIQETVNANNLTERPSNANGGNVNLIENRNNIRENRSNLNRNQADDPTRIDELFCHLRENQNTIRQNIGMSSFIIGGNNLENPNISNIRDLVNSRNNIENEGLRDLRTYFEANLCNFGGQHSTLENPNLSNIRENLTRRGPGVTDYENINPKNVYLSIYDNATVDLRRRNQESARAPDSESSFRNYEGTNEYATNDYFLDSDTVRTTNNEFELGNFEGAVGGRGPIIHGNGPPNSRFPLLEGGDNFANSRQFLPNGNDSGIDINFNNEERKRSFPEVEPPPNDGSIKPKKAEGISDPADSSSLLLPQWQRTDGRDNGFEVSSILSICGNSYFNSRSFQQLDNGDLAEADQSINDETSGAESDTSFVLPQILELPKHTTTQNHRLTDSTFSNRNIPESERQFESESMNSSDRGDAAGAVAVQENGGFPNSTSEPESNFPVANDGSEILRKNETPEGYYYQLNGATFSESGTSKSGVKSKKRGDTSEREAMETKNASGKKSSNKSVDNSYMKYSGSSGVDDETENGEMTVMNERQRTESGESVYSESFRNVLDRNAGGDKGNTSPEGESDWECGSGLDHVPTRLKKRGSSRKSDDSGGSAF